MRSLRETADEEFLALLPPSPAVKKNYLLVAPNQSNLDNKMNYFPVGIAYVSSAMKVSGRKVSVLNFIHADENLYDDLERVIVDNNIDVVMTGGLNAQFKNIKKILDAAKQIKPDIITVAGGGIITSDPEHAMTALENADFGVIGEGEITNSFLAYALETNSDLCDVKGIIYKDKSEWIITEPREEIKNLDIIPWPDYEACGYENSITDNISEVMMNAIEGDRIGFMSFGRSCPFNCTFCFHPSGRKYRQRSIDSCLYQLDYVVEKYRLTYVYISDELLFSGHENTIDYFCVRMKSYGIRYTVSLRVDTFTRDIAIKLRNSGCAQISFGFESADNSILRSMRKNITIEQIEKALEICLDVGINVNANFILGDLEETYETAMTTINWYNAHPVFSAYIRMFWITVYPGTHLYKVACERGIISDPVRFIKEECPMINVSRLSFEERYKINSEMASAVNTVRKKLAAVTIIQDGLGITAEGICPICGKPKTYRNINVFPAIFQPRCDTCGRLISIFALNYLNAETLKNNVEALTRKGTVAVYPVTYIIIDLFRVAPSLLESGLIVDSAEEKQGQEILGKVIMPPDVIADKNIEMVIISSVNKIVINEISAKLRKKYPSVQVVKSISELCFIKGLERIQE